MPAWCQSLLLYVFLVSFVAVSGPGNAQPHGDAPHGGTTNPEVSPNRPGGTTDNIKESRFVIRAISFEARDETGWDFFGSDDVVFTFYTRDYRLETRRYNNIDSDGTVHKFTTTNQCIMPATDRTGMDHHWFCLDDGVAGSVSFIIDAYEQDVDLYPFDFCLRPPLTSDLQDANRLVCQGDNDLIGRDDVTFSLATLLQKLPNVGQRITGELHLLGGCDGSNTVSPCVAGGGPRYVVTYEIQRVSDKVITPPVNPQ